MRIVGGLLLLATSLTLGPPAPAAPVRDDRLSHSRSACSAATASSARSPAFDGKEWTTPWPADLHFHDVPASLDAVPRKWWGKTGPLERMTLWVGGERRGDITLARPAAVGIMCSPRLGLRSDYVSSLPVPEPGEQSYPKDGLVVSGATEVDAVSLVCARTHPNGQRARPCCRSHSMTRRRGRPRIHGLEAPGPAGASGARFPCGSKRSTRRRWMRQGGWRIASRPMKHYAPLAADGDCGLISSASGWIIAGPDGKHWTQLLVHITYCDRMDDVFTLPLGVVRAGGRSYWVYQLSGYDREGYVISRPTPESRRHARAISRGILSGLASVHHDSSSSPSPPALWR